MVNKKVLKEAIDTILLLSSDSLDNSDHSIHEEMARNNQNKNLKEMDVLTLNQQSLCIQYNVNDKAFELMSSMIHLLPTF